MGNEIAKEVHNWESEIGKRKRTDETIENEQLKKRRKIETPIQTDDSKAKKENSIEKIYSEIEDIDDGDFFTITMNNREFRILKVFLMATSDYFSKLIKYSRTNIFENTRPEEKLQNVKEEIINTFEVKFVPYIYNYSQYILNLKQFEIEEDYFVYVYQIASRWRFEKLLEELRKYPLNHANSVKFINIINKKIHNESKRTI